MALGEAVSLRVAIGVGCRRACPAEAIIAVIRAACAGEDIGGAGLFTAEIKRGEPVRDPDRIISMKVAADAA